MQLVENSYEQQPLFALPPNARDIANDFLTRSLAHILQMQSHPDLEILNKHHVSSEEWDNIIAATLVAKTTYILPNVNFSKEELLYLMKIACKNADYSLESNVLADVIKKTNSDMPILSQWLTNMAGLLKNHQAPKS